MTPRVRAPGAAPLVLLLAAALSGCVGLPDSGPVRTVTVQEAGEADTLVDFTPAGPQPGSGPIPLVDGFLTSMTATPVSTAVARQFLAEGSRSRWAPERGTVVYGSQQLVGAPGGGVTLRLRDVVELDERGAWRGDPTAGRGRDYVLDLVREDGEWRVADPPDRLLVPRSHFDRQYLPYVLHFFDPSLSVLVPEPVYVSRGTRTPTLLVQALLAGPESRLSGVERTAFPDDVVLAGSSVRVSRTGTAVVPLSDEVLGIGQTRLSLMVAQLAWTLGQVPGVERVAMSVDGRRVDLTGPADTATVDDEAAVDPAVGYAATEVFGIRDRLVVSATENDEDELSGPFGTLPTSLRSVAVDLLAQKIVGVTGDGRRLLASDRDGQPGEPSRDAIAAVVTGATDLSQPAYDLQGRVWVVDRTAAGARVWLVAGNRARRVAVPGLDGADVRRLLVSRDGTRLLALVRGAGADRLLVARVHRDGQGDVARVGAATRIVVAGVPGRMRDIGWRTPTSIAVLLGSAGGASQVVTVRVDGSATAELAADLEPLQERTVRLVSSPTRGTPLYVATESGRLFSFSGRGRWVPARIDPGLAAATYVG